MSVRGCCGLRLFLVGAFVNFYLRLGGGFALFILLARYLDLRFIRWLKSPELA